MPPHSASTLLSTDRRLVRGSDAVMVTSGSNSPKSPADVRALTLTGLSGEYLGSSFHPLRSWA
eukprot:m.64775 g.64775  ORF g.64775 m.64775 type:complete len:63 (-) comp13613_c0_seq1:3525-3713(-)